MRWIDYGSLRGGMSLFARQWGVQPTMTMLLHLWETNQKLRLVFPQTVTIAPGAVGKRRVLAYAARVRLGQGDRALWGLG